MAVSNRTRAALTGISVTRPWRRSRARFLILALGVLSAIVLANSAAFARTQTSPKQYRLASGAPASWSLRSALAVAERPQPRRPEQEAARAEPEDSSPLTTQPGFNFETAALLAGFAFETYNTPEGARWEAGEDGCDVALLSNDFVPNVYKGLLTVNVRSAEGLRQEAELGESLLTGGRSDPYVLLNVVEDAGKSLLTLSGPAKGSLNEARQGDSVDVQRTSTRWRGGGSDRVTWGSEGEGEALRLYVRDLSTARLGIRVMDENVAKADELLGAAELELRYYVFGGEQAWNGSVPLLWKEKDWDWNLAAVGAAATAATGIATGGAAIAVGAAAMVAKAISPAGNSGSLELEMRYTPLERTPASETSSTSAPPPVGATPGVDWAALAAGVGGIASTVGNYDFLGFVSQRDTNTQAGLWRDSANMRLILAFRGTQQDSLRDFVTDATIVKTRWAAARNGDNSEPEPTTPQVHAGFREALESVVLRLKGLISAACSGEPERWELFLTGHSLGGALATLMALDLAGGLDASRSLPLEPEKSWFGFLGFGGSDVPPEPIGKKFAGITLYTFGAPRVGNKAFAAALDEAVPNYFRVVNSQDVVARVPRGGYFNAGRTALLVNATAGESAPGTCSSEGLWVENETEGRCPLRDDVVLKNPLDSGALLGNLYADMEAGPLAELRASADKVVSDAGELRSRLATANEVAQKELKQLVASAEASASQLRVALDRAGEVGDRLVNLSKSGASRSRLLEFEDSATDEVRMELQAALDEAGRLGQRGERIGRALQAASAGNFTEASSASEAAAQAALVLGVAETAVSSAIEGVLGAVTSARQKAGRILSEATPGQYASVVGFDESYIDLEIQLLSSLGTGKAVIQHLEPSYFAAMTSVTRARPAARTSGNFFRSDV